MPTATASHPRPDDWIPYERSRLRTELTRISRSGDSDAEWALIEPLLPVPACQTPKGGRPEKHHRRDIIDTIRSVNDNATKWRALPADFPPFPARLRLLCALDEGRGLQPDPR
ncbi:transposase [Nonomuraea helvata]|uniref:Transposase n=1 Tax=Nonomuraea helvata TaxID=37484 RepID=A0ABV5S3C7_9ACTN